MAILLRLFLTIVLVSFALFPITASAALDKPVILRVITQAPGSNFYGYATTFSKLIEKYGPAGSKLEVIPRGGSMSNPTTLDLGRCELGFALVSSSIWAWNGLPEVYATHGQHRNIRSLAPGFLTVTYTTVLARREYVEKTGLDTLEKMLEAKDPPLIIIKPQGSVAIPVLEGIFRSVGKNMEDFKKMGKILQVPQAQFGEMLRDNRADVYIDVVPTNHPGVTEVLMTNDLVWIPFSDKIIKYMHDVMAMVPQNLAEGGYKGIGKEGYLTPGDGQNFLIHKDVSDEVAYFLAKLLCENKNILVEENGSLQGWDPAQNLQSINLVMPVHPGAARYYKEQGWMK